MELSDVDSVEASAVGADGLDATDSARLTRLVEYIASFSPRVILSTLLALDHGDESQGSLWDRCIFDHGAVFLFPTDAEAMRKHLATAGFRLGATVPSVVVQRRVCTRYGLDSDSYRIHIVHARRRHPGSPGREQRIEIFFPVTSAAHPLAREDERRHNRETHFAFAVEGLDSSTYLTMRRELAESAGMVPDGGGFNPHDRNHGPGCSTFYFAGPGTMGEHPWPRRLELVCGGRLESALAAHSAPRP
ncbi:hypothetical protein AB0H00_17980 [Nocardia sp. NPDC023852]|uniref:hypothetical protein n=1 Tax=Nocardia sp. NPDC023852 TaxID=3154697 RepID=UPI003403202D